MIPWRLDWPTAHGPRLGTAVFRARPGDFRVIELHEPEGARLRDTVLAEGVPGAGEHLLLELEKTGDNTTWVAAELGRMAGCGERGVGFCGLKDRHAVTRQWFSVQRPGLEADDVSLIRQIEDRWPVLRAVRQLRKQRRGEHAGNHFEITLRNVTAPRPELESRLISVRTAGCPNYFGHQRFGIDGGNLVQAAREADRKPPARRRRRGSAGGAGGGLALSAARSWIFNEVLARRVEDGSWQQRLDGEPEADDITGPLWGDGGTRAEGSQGMLERQAADNAGALLEVFNGLRMAPERRVLKLQPVELGWSWSDSETLVLSFSLGNGQYATSLLMEMLELTDGSQL